MPIYAVLVTLLAVIAAGERSEHACHSKSFRRQTAKLIKETPFIGLFSDIRNQSIFEGSDIARVRDKYYVVFDSSYSIGLLDERFSFRGPENKLIGNKGLNDSQFEGIAYVPENDTFLLLQESFEHAEGYKPRVVTVKLDPNVPEYSVISKCTVDFELEYENKGLEGMLYIKNANGSYLLGLCEGNFCSGGKKGRKSGNGRVAVFQLEDNEGKCRWVLQELIDIPPDADFVDYSAMALDYKSGRVAILSQENAAFWVGEFDIDTLRFKDEGTTVNLPRNDHCQIVYCNAEGIQWIDHDRVIIVSDKAKTKQPFYCDAKDQSVHIFAIPARARVHWSDHGTFAVE